MQRNPYPTPRSAVISHWLVAAGLTGLAVFTDSLLLGWLGGFVAAAAISITADHAMEDDAK